MYQNIAHIFFIFHVTFTAKTFSKQNVSNKPLTVKYRQLSNTSQLHMKAWGGVLLVDGIRGFSKAKRCFFVIFGMAMRLKGPYANYILIPRVQPEVVCFLCQMKAHIFLIMTPKF